MAAHHDRESEIWLKIHKTPAGRAKKIASLVAMLARGETIVPEKKRPSSH
jgi:hypothetical protein